MNPYSFYGKLVWDFEVDKIKMLECLKKDDEDGALLEIEDDLTCQICFGYIMISGK